jgi:hypothetical protein
MIGVADRKRTPPAESPLPIPFRSSRSSKLKKLVSLSRKHCCPGKSLRIYSKSRPAFSLQNVGAASKCRGAFPKRRRHSAMGATTPMLSRNVHPLVAQACSPQSARSLSGFAMLFKKLVEQHRVHRFVAHSVGLTIVIPDHKIRIRFGQFLGVQPKLWRVGSVALVIEGHRL